MPVENYGVLKGPVLATFQERTGGSSPHYQILVVVGQERHRIAVNVLSGDGSEVLFLVDDDFHHPITSQLEALPPGFHAESTGPAAVALDFVRDHLFDRDKMRQLPASTPGDLNDLQDYLSLYVDRATNDPKVAIYAFGSRWQDPPNNKHPLPPDVRFGTAQGVHDIHMNQGNPKGAFLKDNGTWQDGGLLIHFQATDQWVAFFLKFKSQAWFTDAQGNPLPAGQAPPDVENPVVRIVGALVRPKHGKPEKVLLLNTETTAISLQGWTIVDNQGHTEPLGALSLDEGQTATVALSGKGARLADTGGVILLRDDKGNQVDGVTYTKKQAKHVGRMITFR